MTTQVDWVRSCRFRAIIKVVKILMTAGLCDFVKLFVALHKLKFFRRSMASFEEFRHLLVLYYDANLISDEDFLLLYEMFPSKNPNFPYHEYSRFDLDNMSEAECKAEFRFDKKDLPVLAEALQIPPSFKLNQGSIVDGMEGLCMLLRRLAYPCRFGDMVSRFGSPVPVLSMATNHVIDFIYNTHGHRITRWNNLLLNSPALEMYARLIHDKGAALQNCFGFVDGTVRPIARPDQHQRVMYNGHKRVHAIKFQSLVLPNGLIANLYGPVGMFFKFLCLPIINNAHIM